MSTTAETGANRLAQAGVTTESRHENTCIAVRFNGELIAILPADHQRKDLDNLREQLRRRGVNVVL